MSLIAWSLFGAIAGHLAGLFVPDHRRLGVLQAPVVGVMGALIGGVLVSMATDTDYLAVVEVRGVLAATIAAVAMVLTRSAASSDRQTGGRIG